MKLERQVGIGLMKGGGLFLFREAQRKPQRTKVRSLGMLSFQGWPKHLWTTNGPRDKEAETQRAKEESISRQELLT